MQTTSDLNQLRNMIRDVFPSSSRPKSGTPVYPPKLVAAIEDEMRQDNLQPTQDGLNKVSTVLIMSEHYV